MLNFKKTCEMVHGIHTYVHLWPFVISQYGLKSKGKKHYAHISHTEVHSNLINSLWQTWNNNLWPHVNMAKNRNGQTLLHKDVIQNFTKIWLMVYNIHEKANLWSSVKQDLSISMAKTWKYWTTFSDHPLRQFKKKSSSDKSIDSRSQTWPTYKALLRMLAQRGMLLTCIREVPN